MTGKRGGDRFDLSHEKLTYIASAFGIASIFAFLAQVGWLGWTAMAGFTVTVIVMIARSKGDGKGDGRGDSGGR